MGLTRPRAHQLQDSDFKQSVRAIQTSNITLSGGAPSTVDGVSVSLGDRILVTGQSTASQNGIYVVTTVGSGSNGTWARSADADTTGDMTAGMVVMVTEGTSNADTSWKITTDDPITLDTTSITFEQSSAYGYGTIAVSGQSSIVADSVGDTLTVTAGNNISLTTNAGTDTLTVSATGIPTAVSELTNDSGFTTNTGTVTSVAATVPTGLTISGSPVTTTGTLSVAYDTGYAIPTTAKQTQWDSAYTLTSAITATATELNLLDGVTGTLVTEAGTQTLTNKSISGSQINSGTIPDARIQSSGVTQHQASLSITESQISDLGSYITASSTDTLTNKSIAATQLTGTIPDARIQSSGVTQHQADLSITESQISDLGTYLTSPIGLGDIAGANVITSGESFSDTDNALMTAASINDRIQSFGYTTNTGTVTSVSGTGTVNGLTLSGTVTTSGSLTLGGTLGSITVSQLAASAVTTSAESFADNDTTLMTSAAIDDRILSYGYTTNTGTVTSVAMTVPTGLSVSGTPITSSGTLAVSLASGYSIPTTTKQTQWDSAYTLTNAITATSTELNYVDGVTSAIQTQLNTKITASSTDTLTNKTLTSPVVGTDIRLNAQAELEFYDSDSSNYVSFRAPATITSNITWTLPASDGTADQVLATDGAGTLSWADPGSGGGSGSSYPNSTFQTLPGTNGNFDLSYNVAQTSQEVAFEAGGTDAFGVNLGSVFSLMDPVGSVETAAETGLDLGVLT